MKTNILSKKDFLDLAFHRKNELYDKINTPEIFIVKEFYPVENILNLRKKAFEWGQQTEASWHPCLDGCPDYHRIHDNYAKAYVKAKMHAYYYHGFLSENEKLFVFFHEIFDIKNFLAESPSGSYIKDIPSQGQIARVNIHNYPRGGGYQTEHIDPVSKFATLQTIIQASKKGEDFHSGGLYCRKDMNSEKIFIDSCTDIGDLIVLSPGIPHGIEEIDNSSELDWKKNNGRWMIMPIIIHSDYESPNNIKPKTI